ncbi:MAG: imelysin family protein [Acidimicrobiaceae bacterium]|nr:imelysin family protein [Acidimicrobiaceae bacterium]
MNSQAISIGRCSDISSPGRYYLFSRCSIVARLVLAVGFVAIFAFGCNNAPPARSEVLADLADQVIIPAYGQFELDAKALHSSVVDLCASPNEELLSQARQTLKKTRNSWSHLEAMWVGPAMGRRSWAVVRWPVAVDEIEQLIADEAVVLDFDRFANRVGADQRGLGAVEYLLHHSSRTVDKAEGADTAKTNASEVDGEPTVFADPRRCEYLLQITDVIQQEAIWLIDAWLESYDNGPAYKSQFSTAGSESLDSLVNDSLFLLEAITDLELGVALGVMGREANVEVIDEGLSGAGVEDLLHRLASAMIVLVGDDDTFTRGLSPLLEDDLAARLRNSFVYAKTVINGLEPPLRQAVINTPAAVKAVREAIKDIQILLATEVVGYLGVQIGFSDADGDSSG